MHQRRLTPEARVYAIGELARRAGVDAADFQEWSVEIRQRETRVRLGRNSTKEIVFPFNEVDIFACSRFSWPFENDRINELLPNFVVPHVRPLQAVGQPLFALAGDVARCAVDLPCSVFLTLMRCEEEITTERDEHGRFPFRHSLASREGYIERPIVDECGQALSQVISALRQGWSPTRPEMRLKVSHDIDRIGLPFRLRVTLGSALRRQRPFEVLVDMASAFGVCDPIKLRTVRRIVDISFERGLDSAVYWMVTKPTPYDSGCDLDEPRVREKIAWLQGRCVEMGIHPSFYAFSDFDMLASQVERFRLATGLKRFGGRQHYLRWSPQSWADWERVGIAYDSTVGYADHIGFRAGTCFPYHPWVNGRPSPLLEIPLLVMDGTARAPKYMGLSKSSAVERIGRLAARCRLVGGVFTLLYHNDAIDMPLYGVDLYCQMLDAIGAAARFEWEKELEPPVPCAITQRH